VKRNKVFSLKNDARLRRHLIPQRTAEDTLSGVVEMPDCLLDARTELKRDYRRGRRL
jgi:hypothetical protein